jgi:hypothetical protein
VDTADDVKLVEEYLKNIYCYAVLKFF